MRQKEEGVFISDVIYNISKEEEEPTVQRLWMLSNTLYIHTLPTNTSNQHNQFFYCKSGEVMLIIVQSQDIENGVNFLFP